jgi:hypothetical protein
MTTVLSAAPAAGRLVITWYAAVHHHRTVIARGSAALQTEARARITVKLTAAGRKLLAKAKLVRITTSGDIHLGATEVTGVRTSTLRR